MSDGGSAHNSLSDRLVGLAHAGTARRRNCCASGINQPAVHCACDPCGLVSHTPAHTAGPPTAPTRCGLTRQPDTPLAKTKNFKIVSTGEIILR